MLGHCVNLPNKLGKKNSRMNCMREKGASQKNGKVSEVIITSGPCYWDLIKKKLNLYAYQFTCKGPANQLTTWN